MSGAAAPAPTLLLKARTLLHVAVLYADAPPPLSSLADQMYAVQLADSIIGTAGLQEGELRTAAVTDSLGKQAPSCHPATIGKPAAAKQILRKGFLDAKPRSSSQQGSSKVRAPCFMQDATWHVHPQ